MKDDLARYQRQMLVGGIGEDGQRRLLAATAFVAGCGALGCLIAELLARAGVGHLILLDRDFVEVTNLQRQLLYDESDISPAIPKAEAARRRLTKINSGIEVRAIVDDLNHRNIDRYAAGADVLIDGLDNFEGRFLLNDFAVKNAVPYIYGAAVGTAGCTLTILPHTATGDALWESLPNGSRATPCLRCLYEDAPPPGTLPTCETVGVLSAVVTTIASLQAAESLKVLTGNFSRIATTMTNVDLWTNEINQLQVAAVREHADCACCKHGIFEFLDGTRATNTEALCGRDAIQLRREDGMAPVELAQVAARLRELGEVRLSEFMLRAEVVENEQRYGLSLFRDGRAIIHGTAEPAVARGIYAKFIGN